MTREDFKQGIQSYISDESAGREELMQFVADGYEMADAAREHDAGIAAKIVAICDAFKSLDEYITARSERNAAS